MKPFEAVALRQDLRERLSAAGDRVLLRIVPSPHCGDVLELRGREIVSRAHRLVAATATTRPPGVVLLLLPHSSELFLLQIGLVLDGYCPAVLPWPTSRVDTEKYQRNLLHQLRALPADELITVSELAINLSPGLAYPVTACSIEGGAAFKRIFLGAFVPEPSREQTRGSGTHPTPDAVFLQFSGGTTGVQKSVVVTASLLRAQLQRLRKALELSEEDSVVSWLPLYHDMGLIACLWFPLWFGMPSLQFAASDWLLNPEALFHYMGRFRGTFCWLPNFGFSYLAQRRQYMKGAHSLAHVRAWINCSEPVRLRSMRRFTEQFSDWGVTAESVQTSYAMAENIFAVTQSKVGSLPPSIARSRVRVAGSSYSELAFDLIDHVYVSSGQALDDTQVRIVDPAGQSCEDRRAGEIQIRTPSLFGGYWSTEGFITRAFTSDGWYATGDYGFLDGKELYVIGRLKDIIIVGGQNIFPEDVEMVVGTADRIYPGRVAVFGVEDDEMGTEALAVVAEIRGDYDAETARTVEDEIRRLVQAAIGIAPRHVAVVPERWMVKSTAGKISRRDTKERLLRDMLGKIQAEAFSA